MHTFPAQLPDQDRIQPDRVGKITATACSKHLNGLSGDSPLVFNQTIKGDQSYNITIAMQNVTEACAPHHKTGHPSDDCRFAAWTAMAKSGLVDIAFQVDAHCDPIDTTRSVVCLITDGSVT